MKLLKDIFLLILGGIIAVIGNYWIFSAGNEIPYIDKHVTTDISVISKENLLSNDVKILVGKDEKEVDKISKATIYLVNYSNKFFKDMEILLKINNPDSKIKLLSTHASGENNEERMVVLGENNGIDSFKYIIKTAKRTDKYDEFFKLIIYYEGDSEFKDSDFTVTVLNAEAKVRKFEREHSPEDTNNKFLSALILFGVICGAIIFFVLFIMLISRLTKSQNKKLSQKYATRVYKASSKVDLLNEIPEDKRKTVISQLLYEQIKERRQASSKFELFLEGKTEPELDDYKVLDEI